MNIDFSVVVGFLLRVILLFVLLLVIFKAIASLMQLSASGIKKQAIERGYALHCPADGKFAWEGECEE